MIQTLIVICALALAGLGRFRGFVFMWVVLLNTVLAIYISIMVIPTLVGFFPLFGDRYLLGSAMIAIPVALFTILSKLVHRFFADAIEYRLPVRINPVGTVVCATVAAFLSVNYFLFVIGITRLTDALVAENPKTANPLSRAVAHH